MFCWTRTLKSALEKYCLVEILEKYFNKISFKKHLENILEQELQKTT